MPRPLRITVTVNGRTVTASATCPPERARLDQLLPALRALDDAVIDHKVRELDARDGRRVSCMKGCSACCKAQPVPVTPPEAYALSLLVAGLPEPRQSHVRAAFDSAVQRLREANLFNTYMGNREGLSRDAARDTALRYFDLKISCPFLVDGACSIYSERPFVCRQYLVTTPPALCADPLNKPVAPVPIPARFASAILAMIETTLGAPRYTVPLVLALTYVDEKRKELERTFPAKALMERTLRLLSKISSRRIE